MENANRASESKTYPLTLAILSLLGLLAAFVFFPVSPENFIFLAVLTTAAVLIELTSVEMPYYGYASFGLIVYTAGCLINPAAGWQSAAIAAFLAIGIRTAAVNKQPLWFKICDYVSSLAVSLITIAAYTLISLMGQGAAFSVIAVLAAMAASYLGDFMIISTTANSVVPPENQKAWNNVRNKIRLLGLLYIPLALLARELYEKIPVLLALFFPVIYVLKYVTDIIVQEFVAVNQDEMSVRMKAAEGRAAELAEENDQVTEELRKKVDELSIVYEMSKALGASTNLDSTLEIILSMIRKLLLYQSCIIFLLEKGELVPAKAITPYKDILGNSTLLQLEETIVNLVVQNRKPLLVPDMQAMNEQRIFKNEICIMCVPLVIKEKIIGVLYVGSTKQSAYTHEQLNMLSILGNSAAIAIVSAQLYQEKEHSLEMMKDVNNQLEQSISQLSALNEFSKFLGSSLKKEDTLNFICGHIKSIVDFQTFVIFTLRKVPGNPALNQAIVPQRALGPFAGYFADISFEMNEGVVGWVIANKKPLLLEDSRDFRLPNLVEQELSAIIVPMVAENDVIGAVYIGSPKPKYYNESSLNLISMATQQTAMALKNAELYEKMVSLAITDGLTGLYTHRYFQERLNEFVKEFQRSHKFFSLIMIDTDRFKSYNDTLGHPEGDKLLQQLSKIIKGYTRDSDLVSRYGGDEFAVILKDSDKENALRIAERIREAVQYAFSSHQVQITSSIGIATFPSDAENKPDLLTAADAALYQSKNNGRNRVSWAPSLKEQGGKFIKPQTNIPIPRESDSAAAAVAAPPADRRQPQQSPPYHYEYGGLQVPPEQLPRELSPAAPGKFTTQPLGDMPLPGEQAAPGEGITQKLDWSQLKDSRKTNRQ